MNVVIQLFLFDFSKCSNDYECSRKEHRLKEYTVTLLKNASDPHIKSIHVLAENKETVDYFEPIVSQISQKVIFTIVGHQPTYKEIMEYVKKTFVSKEIVCVMNADIFFNSEKDHLLIQKHLKENHLFALTRHEITDEGHTICNLETCPFTGGGSSDTFIFYTPLPDSLRIENMTFHQNLFGAEAVFEKFWVDAGYELWNPCLDIITLHLHKDRIHFQSYQKINTPENSAANWKTPLPPV